jgi:3-hydroxyacyl-[acyl-carrier-protein] dehydratase
MLEGSFFKIISSEVIPAGDDQPSAEHIRVRVELDPNHRIYAGHFPGNPVVPGVCQVQMAKEALEMVKNTKGMLVSGDNIKFLNMIVPSDHPALLIDYIVKNPGDGNLSYNATISDAGKVFMKFRGILCTKPY